ncbi:MAG: NEW3 domain-containing protein [Streptosporangiaceae bacterium]
MVQLPRQQALRQTGRPIHLELSNSLNIAYANTSAEQVFAKTEKNGDVIVGLFSTTGSPTVDSVTASALGLPTAKAYTLDNLWTGQTSESAGTIGATVAPDGVALFRVTPAQHVSATPPGTTLSLSGPASLTGGQPATATASFSNDGAQPVQNLDLRLHAPAGWTVTPTSATHFASVDSGETAHATFAITAPTPATPIQQSAVSVHASYRWKTYVPERALQTYDRT